MRAKCTESILWSASRKGTLYTYAIFGALVLLLVLMVLAFQSRYNINCKHRIIELKVRLGTIRNSIQTFFECNGRYPNSFDEFRQYVRDKRGYSSMPKMYVDLNSDKQRDVPEYRKLNNKGGYYYDPNTGDVRLNLTRPVKEYLKWYQGRYKDEVPSSW